MKVSTTTTLFTASMALSLSAMALPIFPAGGVDSRTSLSVGESDMKRDFVSSAQIGTAHAVVKARDTDVSTVTNAYPGVVGALVPVVNGVGGIISAIENVVLNLPGGDAAVGVLKGLGLKASETEGQTSIKEEATQNGSDGYTLPVNIPITGAYLPNVPGFNLPFNPAEASVPTFPNVIPGYTQAQGVAGLSDIPEVLPGVVDFGMGTVVPGVSMANVGQAEELAALKGSLANMPVLPDTQAPSLTGVQATESLSVPTVPSAAPALETLAPSQTPIALVSTPSGLFVTSASPSIPSTPSGALAYVDGGILIPNAN